MAATGTCGIFGREGRFEGVPYLLKGEEKRREVVR